MTRLLVTCIILLLLFNYTSANVESHDTTSNATGPKTIQLAQWKFAHLKNFVTIALFLFAVIAMKMIYEYFEVVASVIPESCMLIVVGVIAGVILRLGAHVSERDTQWALIPDTFFFILLPPIVLDSAHGLCQRAFADVFGSVMLFAVVATSLNFIIIGLSLYGLNIAGAMGVGAVKISIRHCLLFGSLIVAVDPVAVLAIFEEIGVDKTLYFLVFGESLFNDAVTIVLYNMMVTFVQMETIGAVDIVLGVVSFFTVSLGGAAVGLIFGILSCLMTRCSTHCAVLQPAIIIIVAYTSYIAGDLFGWSGIISMIACGILQATYAFHNMHSKSVLVTRRVIKLISNLAESIVFFYLGIEVTRGALKWDTGFILWALALCLIVRFLITFALSALLNKTGAVLKRISFTEQFIIGYGGLRGAVAFSLATLIKDSVFLKSELEKDHFLTATLFIVLFTIFPMGITMKPLVKLLKIKLETEKSLSLMDEINDNVTDHFTAGLEAICGIEGENLTREWLDIVDIKYVRPFLQNNPEELSQRIVDVYEKVALTLHYANIEHGRSGDKHLDKLPEQVKDKYLAEYERRRKLAKGEPKEGMVHGVSTLLSIVEPGREQVDVEEKRIAFASKKFSVNPNVEKDDYMGILKYNARRGNTIYDADNLPHEHFTQQMHNVFRRKTNCPNLRQDAVDCDSAPSSAKSSPLYQPVRQDETDGAQSHRNNDDIELPEIVVRPHFEVDTGEDVVTDRL